MNQSKQSRNSKGKKGKAPMQGAVALAECMARPYQLHLSTLLVLLLAAGMLLWLNTTPESHRNNDWGVALWGRIRKHGWPMIAYTSIKPTVAYGIDGWRVDMTPSQQAVRFEPRPFGICINCAVLLIALWFVAYFMEFCQRGPRDMYGRKLFGVRVSTINVALLAAVFWVLLMAIIHPDFGFPFPEIKPYPFGITNGWAFAADLAGSLIFCLAPAYVWEHRMRRRAVDDP